MNKKRKSFLATRNAGAIIRVFCKKREEIFDKTRRVWALVKAIEKSAVDMGNFMTTNFVKRIDIVVWADNKYLEKGKPAADCGGTADELRGIFKNRDNVFVHEFRDGDLFCDLLNYGVYLQIRHACDYSMIVSPESHEYVTPETMGSIVDALSNGALVAGVAISEITQSILEGRIANAFSVWHNATLHKAGYFDSKLAGKPIDDDVAMFARGWSEDVKDYVYYPINGVEEMGPLGEMHKMFADPLDMTKCLRPFIAPILPSGEGVKRYFVPDPVKNPELWKRHVEKIDTKYPRQFFHLKKNGIASPLLLKGAVMPEYRNQK